MTPVDARRDLARYTVDVTTAVAFGLDMNLIERGTDPLSHQLETVFAALNRRVFAPFPYWRHVKLPADRALDQALSEVRTRMLDILRTTRAELDRDPARAAAPRSLLEALLVARDAEDPKARLSEQEVLRRHRAGKVEAIVLNPTLLLGPGDDRFSSTEDVLRVLQGRVPASTHGTVAFVEASAPSWTRTRSSTS